MGGDGYLLVRVGHRIQGSRRLMSRSDEVLSRQFEALSSVLVYVYRTSVNLLFSQSWLCTACVDRSHSREFHKIRSLKADNLYSTSSC